MAGRGVFSKCLGVLLAGVLAVGCGVSPQPTPPGADLDGRLIGVTAGVELYASVTGFHAAPGTVDPPTGVVLVTNLDAKDAPSIADVRADGSFDIAVPGQPGETYRFQAKNGNARSNPFDVVVGSSGADLAAVTQTAGCVVLDPAQWLALDSAPRDLEIHNACSEAIGVAAPHLRRGLAGFSFAPASPFSLAAGETGTITVRTGSGNEVEDVLFLDLTGPITARRAVTLTVPDR